MRMAYTVPAKRRLNFLLCFNTLNHLCLDRKTSDLLLAKPNVAAIGHSPFVLGEGKRAYSEIGLGEVKVVLQRKSLQHVATFPS